MRPRPPKYKVVHSKAEREYFKSLADKVREAREQATGKQPDTPAVIITNNP